RRARRLARQAGRVPGEVAQAIRARVLDRRRRGRPPGAHPVPPGADAAGVSTRLVRSQWSVVRSKNTRKGPATDYGPLTTDEEVLMHPTRRDFLKTSLAAGSLVALGLTVPKFLTRTALAAPPADKPGAKDTLLVVVQMTGGNDGLNTVVPHTDPEYAKLRK